MDSDPFSTDDPGKLPAREPSKVELGAFSLVVICAILLLVSTILIVVYWSGEKRNSIKSNTACTGWTAGIACNVSNTPVSKKKKQQSNPDDDDNQHQRQQQQELRCQWISYIKESTSIGLKVLIPESLVFKQPLVLQIQQPLGFDLASTDMAMEIEKEKEKETRYEFVIYQEKIPGFPEPVWQSEVMNQTWDANGFILQIPLDQVSCIMSNPECASGLSVGVGPKVYRITPLPSLTLETVVDVLHADPSKMKSNVNYFKRSKTLWLIRHGESRHNADDKNREVDPGLSPLGKEQCSKIQGPVPLVIVSPMLRAQETLALSHLKYNRKITSPLFREAIMHGPSCLMKGEVYEMLQESESALVSRVQLALDFIQNQAEDRIAIVGHGTFLTTLVRIVGHGLNVNFFNAQVFQIEYKY
jgi:broad specificity phosphatase PhoE